MPAQLNERVSEVAGIGLIVSCMAVAFMAATACDKSGSQPVIRLSDSMGTLEVSDTMLVADDSGYAKLVARYRNQKGLFTPDKIVIKDVPGTVEGYYMIFSLSIQPGIYEVTAETLSIKVRVVSR